MKEYSQPRDPRVASAIAHPTRSAILELLIGKKGLAPRSISETLEIGVANAAYHVEVLLSCGAVETVPGGKRGGERPVRLPRPAERAPAVQKNWLDVSGSMREDVSAAQLKSLIETASHLRPREAPGT